MDRLPGAILKTMFQMWQCLKDFLFPTSQWSQPQQFGGAFTVDHKVLNDENESRLQHRYAVGVQEICCCWIQCYPTKHLNCKYSQVHMSVMYEQAQGTHDVTTPTTHNKGWRFVTESPWTLWHTGGSRQGHPRYTSASTRKAVGGPTQAPRHDRRPTTARQRQGLGTNVL